MSVVEFEPTISAGERPQTYAWDRAATGTGKHTYLSSIHIRPNWHFCKRTEFCVTIYVYFVIFTAI